MEESYAWVSACVRISRQGNTGFGSLARVKIDPRTSKLSLICSGLMQWSGTAASVPEIQAMMLLRANALAKGASGCRPVLVDT